MGGSSECGHLPERWMATQSCKPLVGGVCPGSHFFLAVAFVAVYADDDYGDDHLSYPPASLQYTINPCICYAFAFNFIFSLQF